MPDGNLTPQSRAASGNPDVSNTAARYVAKAMTRVAPWQREELLLAIIDHAHDGIAVISRGRAA